MKIFKPQEGPQTKFLETAADICIYGGAAGGGKSYALLLEAVRHSANPGFGAVIFRRNSTQIFNEGGLWDTSEEIYSGIAQPRKTPSPRWLFPSGAKIGFAHLENDLALNKWQGSQIAMIGFDELTHFSKKQFFYMLSRNRSTCGIKPYVRGTCNPDCDSFVADLIAWYIDQNTGYPIPERSGVVRYMGQLNDQILWGDTPEEVAEASGYELGVSDVKTFTFIASKLSDNKVLMESNPGYLANLKALSTVERERLLEGNWKIRPAAGMYFKRSQVNLIEQVPSDVKLWVRAWDLAATEETEGREPAYTAGVLMGKRKNGNYVIADVTNVRLKAGAVREHIKNTALMDKAKYKRVKIRLPQDPGQAGKDQAESYLKFLAGFPVVAIRESGSKESRAEPLAAQWQGLDNQDKGNVEVVIADWNEPYFQQMESFPESKFKDMVDGSSSAFAELEKVNVTSGPPKGDNLSKDSYWKH